MSQPSQPIAAPVAAPSAVAKLLSSRSLRDSTLLLVLAAIWLFFYFATNGTFLTQRNLILLALQTAIVGLAAISAVMLIVTRNFDLSVGSAVALIGVVVALLTVKFNVDPIVAVLVCVGAGLLMGAWQGWWVTRMKVSSFIVTLAGMLYFRGISMIATNGATVAPLPAGLKQIATGFLPPDLSIVLILVAFGLFAAFNVFELRRGLALGIVANFKGDLIRALLPSLAAAIAAIWLASSKGVPYLIVLVAVCAIAADILMRRTRFGVQLYAIGGNPEAARLSGINVDRMIFINFVIAGLGYAITGVALTARVSGAIAGSAGLFLELDAIAAAIIGGTSLSGGRGRVFGALVGALLMGSLNNGMSLMNVPTFYQDTARGIVLLLAVAIDQLSRRRSTVVR
ncbi:sugar ABC transporter permease [Mesorhizobium sp. INR15]|uniref:sugar ABC transporter permease n=1 Tax=Mesorhizobium sp. INR15 TaxID=2654248 RepID=UPI00189692F1|nr:sugar ABC transporter permease [Mesorhizobium sp. INR15]